MFLRCEDGHGRRVEVRCSREDCLDCAEAPEAEDGRRDVSKSYLARRRGRRLAPKVWQNLGDRALLHTTFTVPEELRPLAADREWWELRVRALRRQLRKHWDLDWALASYHPVGDRGGPDRFHPHLHVLWVRREDAADIWPTGPSGWLEPAALERLRHTWAEVLDWPTVVDVHHNYIDARDRAREAKVWHRVQYIARPFPGWSDWRGQVPRWWGRPPPADKTCDACGTVVPEDLDEPICPCCGVALGILCEECGGPMWFVGIARADPTQPEREEVHSSHGPRPGGT